MNQQEGDAGAGADAGGDAKKTKKADGKDADDKDAEEGGEKAKKPKKKKKKAKKGAWARFPWTEMNRLLGSCFCECPRSGSLSCKRVP